MPTIPHVVPIPYLHSPRPHPSLPKLSPPPPLSLPPYPTSNPPLPILPSSPKTTKFADAEPPRGASGAVLVDNDAAAEMLAAPVFAVEEGHFGSFLSRFLFLGLILLRWGTVWGERAVKAEEWFFNRMELNSMVVFAVCFVCRRDWINSICQNRSSFSVFSSR